MRRPRFLRPPEPFRPEWRTMLEERMVHWRALDESERARLETLAGMLLARKSWEPARGFVLTDEIRVTIASQAALLILGLPDDSYRNVSAIVVHPTTVTLHGPRAAPIAGLHTDAPMPILGQAQQHRGPVVIAWDAARTGARHPERGHNVVYHEFAHKLDMLDGTIDGMPPLPDRAAAARWIDVCTRHYEALRGGTAGPLLDPYGSVNPGEFFAVATELFFDRPVEMCDELGDLYDVLRSFYRQDPAARERAA